MYVSSDLHNYESECHLAKYVKGSLSNIKHPFKNSIILPFNPVDTHDTYFQNSNQGLIQMYSYRLIAV